MLCGASPIEASSGKIVRHRFNRGGDRQANAALYHVVMPRRSVGTRRPRTTWPDGPRKAGPSEVIRCLKRYVAREIYLTLKRMSLDRVTTTLAHQVASRVDPEAVDIHRRVNLARWTARIGLGAGIITTKTLRRRLFGLPGRFTRSARRVILHLPARSGDPAPRLTGR
jgi:hypothetical protein